jgi:hypothetical protein
MRTYLGSIRKNKDTNTWYVFDVIKGAQINIIPNQQEIFNDDFLGLLLPYIECESEAIIIFENQFSVTHIQDLEYKFALTPYEADKVEDLKTAINLLYGPIKEITYQFTPNKEFGRTVSVIFPDLGIVKDITDRRNSF